MLEEAFSTNCQDCSSGKVKCIFWYASQCKGVIHSKFTGLTASSYVCLAVLLLHKKTNHMSISEWNKKLLLRSETIYCKHVTLHAYVEVWVPATFRIISKLKKNLTCKYFKTLQIISYKCSPWLNHKTNIFIASCEMVVELNRLRTYSICM